MKKTQKGLMLAVVFCLTSGQALQADWRETAKTGLQKVKSGAKQVGATATQTAGQAKQVWNSIDPETKQKITSTVASVIRAYIGGQIDPELKKQIDANLDKKTKDALQKAVVAQATGTELDAATKKQIGNAAMQAVVGLAK